MFFCNSATWLEDLVFAVEHSLKGLEQELLGKGVNSARAAHLAVKRQQDRVNVTSVVSRNVSYPLLFLVAL